jgi:hypothetical protein
VKRLALCALALSFSVLAGACGDAVCGPKPPAESCPTGWVCECFVTACGWGCPGAPPGGGDERPDGGPS